MDASGDWTYRLDGEGKFWLGYYDETRLLRVRTPSGNERLMVPDDRNQAPSGIAMASLENGVATLWRDKHPKKGLYLARANQPDEPALELAGESEPLARFAAERTADRVHVLWYGERKIQDSDATYHIYYTGLDLDDNSSPPAERLFAGIYPVMATDEAGGVMAFSWLRKGEAHEVVARFRAADAAAFADSVVVAGDLPEITPLFRAFRSGTRWFVIWHAQYGEKGGELLLEGAYSDDTGATWHRFAFDELKGLDLGSIDIAADDTGHIVMALTARDRSGGAKRDVVLIRSNDRGKSWKESERLRPNGSLDAFQAKNPSVTFGAEKGQVLVVWEDWREIRSRLYASYSDDYGDTWKYHNVPLPHEPETNLGLKADLSAAYEADERFHVVAEQYTDDSFRKKKLVRVSFSVSDLGRFAQRPSVAPESSPRSEDGLEDTDSDTSDADNDAETPEDIVRGRVAAFWTAMAEGEYAKVYEMFDPFFRALNSKERYLATTGKITYGGFEIESLTVDGPKADAKTKIRVSIKPFRASTGETISRPETETSVDETWLLIDGTWYREFVSEAQDLKYTRY